MKVGIAALVVTVLASFGILAVTMAARQPTAAPPASVSASPTPT